MCDAQGSHINLQAYHVDTAGAVLCGLSVSSSGETVVMSDSAGFLHQWADRDGARFGRAPLHTWW
jgi:hypothetical protein